MRKLIGKLRQRWRARFKKERRFIDNRANAIRRYKHKTKSREKFPALEEVRRAVERLTNWQRSMWGRDGYKRDPEVIEKFALMQRRKNDTL